MAVATDRNGSEIRHDDTVRELGGEIKTGVIMHIHRSFLFLHNREQTENSGIFVVRAANVATVAAKGGRIAQQTNAGPDLSRMNPAVQANGDKNRSLMPSPKMFGRDPTLGKTVVIRKGPYKGLLGIVKDTTDSEARVELHTKGKTVQVVKEILSIKDAVTGNSVPYNEFVSRRPGGAGRGAGGFGGTPNGGGATPSRNEWSGSRTPIAAAAGGRTPAWGAAMPARTPAWSGAGGSSGGPASSPRVPRWGQADSGRTPAWNNDGGRTAYGGATSYGGGTSYAGAGGRTPAWNNDGGRTAYGGPSGGSDPYAGARTPAQDSSRTPAWAGASAIYANANSSGPAHDGPSWARPHDAPTPAAPTPGNPYAAPTPAAAAPTPKYSGYGIDAPTPAGAPTPYGVSAETPAAWAGDDDGPRYEESPSP